jgi:hypothetical protein
MRACTIIHLFSAFLIPPFQTVADEEQRSSCRLAQRANQREKKGRLAAVFLIMRVEGGAEAKREKRGRL